MVALLPSSIGAYYDVLNIMLLFWTMEHLSLLLELFCCFYWPPKFKIQIPLLIKNKDRSLVLVIFVGPNTGPTLTHRPPPPTRRRRECV